MNFRAEIVGSIAVGKSTLCEQLESRGYHIIRENLDENPYLHRIYTNRASRGFDVQMAFLLSKASAIETYSGNASAIVCDYSLVTEYAYAAKHLKSVDDDAFRLSIESIDLKRAHIGAPDVIIGLSCPLDAQMERIRQRGRAFEQSLTPEYLAELNDHIATYFYNKTEPGVNLIRIDTQAEDLRDSGVIDNVVGQIENIRKNNVKNHNQGLRLTP